MKNNNIKKLEEKNLAFVDGQNLYMGTDSDDPKWKVDLVKFRFYLLRKYKVEKAYYYLGYVNEKYQYLYEEIQAANFILVFRQYNTEMISKKKGNVDSDIIFNIMKRLYKRESFDKVILVSGDGDYKMLIDFLIEENKLKKILFPNKQFASSLYKKLASEYYDYLGNNEIKVKIKKGSP